MSMWAFVVLIFWPIISHCLATWVLMWDYGHMILDASSSGCCLLIRNKLGHNIVLAVNVVMNGWMDERCFKPLLCTVKAELGRGQPGLMRWIWDETLPQSSIDRSTFYSAAHRATKWASGHNVVMISQFLHHGHSLLCLVCILQWLYKLSVFPVFQSFAFHTAVVAASPCQSNGSRTFWYALIHLLFVKIIQ